MRPQGSRPALPGNPSNITPRICDVQADKSGNCFGEEPKVGDLILLLDDSGIVGEARITEVQPFALAGRGKGCDGGI